MSLSMEERLKRRKLDALKRGVHRVTGGDSLPMTTHVVGIGKAGADAVAQMLRDLEPDASKFTALVIDIGDQDLTELRQLAAQFPTPRVALTIIGLEVPKPVDLFAVLSRSDEYLRLEYPNYPWVATHQSWLPVATDIPAPGQHFDRAVAKAIYFYAYYSGQRTLERALRSFAVAVDDERSQAVVAVVFGLGGGTGSGIAVDLARHMSNGLFGRRALVLGVGIAPCDGDQRANVASSLFSVLSELDVLCDEHKNQGIVRSCGEMFRNPFTAGFIMVPQQQAWRATQDLPATNRLVAEEIASLMTARGGKNLWELLRLLNWVAAPSTQHSAARTPWGPQWIHMLASMQTVPNDLPNQLGLLPTYRPEFIEIRVNDLDAQASALADSVEAAFAPEVPPQIVAGGREGPAQIILPRIAKTDLSQFIQGLAGYEAAAEKQRLLQHALLLEQGIMLCEPSTRLQGMAGASLGDSNGWIAVPLADIRGQSDDAEQHQVDRQGQAMAS